jgi:hypothetical protein
MNAPDEQPPTDEQLVHLIDQYRAGLEAEIAILHQLAEAAHRQGADSGSGDADAFHKAADERDRLMQGLVTIEADMRPVRAKLSACREQASRLAGFADVASLHRDAAHRAAGILSTDQQSLRSLADAEVARRSAVAGIERGETTLAAYRRVLTPPLSSPTLVDRRG